jgi:hypothetical protein
MEKMRRVEPSVRPIKGQIVWGPTKVNSTAGILIMQTYFGAMEGYRLSRTMLSVVSIRTPPSELTRRHPNVGALENRSRIGQATPPIVCDRTSISWAAAGHRRGP